MAKGFFVTGTDTNIGKTVLSALLCSSLPARYWKPIQTGASEGSDRQQVIRLSGMAPDLAAPEAYVFDDPVSPHMAAQRAGEEISLERIRLPEYYGDLPVIVEGAGGIMVPINRAEFMKDLMRRLGLPVILASRSTLGTINHTLLSINALRDAGLEVLGVVLIGPEDTDNRHAIERYGGIAVIGHIPVLQEISREALVEVFAQRFDRRLFL
jgi:dethiobiotin synthase